MSIPSTTDSSSPDPGLRAFLGAEIFDGTQRQGGLALLVRDGQVMALLPPDHLPAGAQRVVLPGGLLAPGFIDLQVNGGGGVLFNAQPTPAGLATILRAHARHGTTALLPTLISDSAVVTDRAIAAVRQAIAAGLPGCIGLHLEGPHLAQARRGAHDPALLRPMAEVDLHRLTTTGLRHLLVTLAPEAVQPAQVAALAAAGVVVSLGHSDADHATLAALVEAGARGVTHLFNAMRPIQAREPGLAGLALDDARLSCGLIADGLHVHPALLRLAARLLGDRLCLVSDAMPSIGMADAGFGIMPTALSRDRSGPPSGAGRKPAVSLASRHLPRRPFGRSDQSRDWSAGSTGIGMADAGFELNGRRVTLRDGRLTLPDGTLAGAHLTLDAALRCMVRQAGVPVEAALRMASANPAAWLGLGATHGHLRPGARADMVWLDAALAVRGVWIGGQKQPP